MLLVSHLYQQNRVKESYFWEAQRLTLRDAESAHLKQTFTDIVSGIEDMRDAQATLDLAVQTTGQAMAEWEGWAWTPSATNEADLADSPWQQSMAHKGDLESLSPEERELVAARSQFFNSALQRSLAPVPEDAHGLYVVTKPRLGLAQYQ